MRRWSGSTNEVSSNIREDDFMEPVGSPASLRQVLDEGEETDWEAMGGSLPDGLDISDGGLGDSDDWADLPPVVKDMEVESGPSDLPPPPKGLQLSYWEGPRSRCLGKQVCWLLCLAVSSLSSRKWSQYLT